MKKFSLIFGLAIVLIVVLGIVSVQYKKTSDEQCSSFGEGYIYVPGSGCMLRKDAESVLKDCAQILKSVSPESNPEDYIYKPGYGCVLKEVVDKNNATELLSNKPKSTDQWIIAQFPSWRSEFPLIISYPKDWKFSCCADMDTQSSHILAPPNAPKRAQIIITEHSLAGCPVEKPRCSIDEIIRLSPETKLKAVIEETKQSGFVEIKPRMLKINAMTVAYESKNSGSMRYILRGSNFVISIRLDNYSYYGGSDFINTFLDRLALNHI